MILIDDLVYRNIVSCTSCYLLLLLVPVLYISTGIDNNQTWLNNGPVGT